MNTSLNNDQQCLVCENLEWAEQLAWRFGRSIMGDKHEKSITMDDLKQEAVCGLMEAAMRWRPTPQPCISHDCESPLKGEGEETAATFQTYAFIWIRKFVLRAVRKFGTPLSVPCNFEGGVELLHLDVMMEDVASGYASGDDDGSPADRLMYEVAVAEDAERDEQEGRKALVERMLEGLSAKERKALECLFALDGVEMSGKETAEVLGVVPGRVSQLKERALRKLEMETLSGLSATSPLMGRVKLPIAC